MIEIVQHCFGTAGSGGPVVAMERLLRCSPVLFGELRQTEAAGGVNFALLVRFVTELRRMRPKLLHVRGLGNEGFHAVLAARLAGVPNILVPVHGTQRDLKFANRFRQRIVVRILEPLTLAMATHVATVCEHAAKREFLRRYIKKLVAVVPNGVGLPTKSIAIPPSVRAEFGLPQDVLMAVTVSRITKEKGYLTLAAALHRLDNTGVRFALVVVGGGDEQGVIKQNFNCLKNIIVQFVGHRSDVGRILSQADFFVFPSLHENLSNALLEAMSYALPVIATQTGGNTEVINRGGGVLVPPGEAEPLAEAIKLFVNDASFRRELGEKALSVIKSNYTIEKMVSSWIEVYEGILGGKIGTS